MAIDLVPKVISNPTIAVGLLSAPLPDRFSYRCCVLKYSLILYIRVNLTCDSCSCVAMQVICLGYVQGPIVG